MERSSTVLVWDLQYDYIITVMSMLFRILICDVLIIMAARGVFIVSHSIIVIVN